MASIFSFNSRFASKYMLSERGTQISANTVNLPCAVTPRQVVIKKLLNYLLVDTMNGESALGRPASKVGNARDVGINGVRTALQKRYVKYLKKSGDKKIPLCQKT